MVYVCPLCRIAGNISTVRSSYCNSCNLTTHGSKYCNYCLTNLKKCSICTETIENSEKFVKKLQQLLTKYESIYSEKAFYDIKQHFDKIINLIKNTNDEQLLLLSKSII